MSGLYCFQGLKSRLCPVFTKKLKSSGLKSLYFTGLAFVFGLLPSFTAFAEEAEQASASGGGGLYALSAGLAIALAAFGGALAQGRVGASAMEGIARNPQAQKIMFIPMIIVLALIESFVIFSFAIAMIIAGKI